jgi:predicted ABC-type transport system involved in lysophospholipase L1 biosynthesis ATPase subunit
MLDLDPRTNEIADASHAVREGLVLALQALPVAGQLLDLRLLRGYIVVLEGGRAADRLRVLGIAAGLGFRGPGRCRLRGVCTRELSSEARRDLRQQIVGRMLHVDRLPAGLSTRGAVAVPLLVRGVAPPIAFERASALLETLGVAAIGGRRTESLSARERRLALLARALIAQPSLLVLEDPGDGLIGSDLAAVRAVLRVAAAVDGCSVLLSSAEPRLAALADQRVDLDAG